MSRSIGGQQQSLRFIEGMKLVMTAHTSAIGDTNVRGKLRAHPPRTSTSSLIAYQLDVIAVNVVDAVSATGGWLFDRAMAGWSVNVSLDTTDGPETRPLRVLGVNTLSLGSAPDEIADRPRTQALAVAADVFTRNAHVRRRVETALNSGLEVTFWGDNLPAELDHRVEHVQYRLSAAARAFKARALAAAGVPSDAVGRTEKFRGRPARYAPADWDLTPAG